MSSRFVKQNQGVQIVLKRYSCVSLIYGLTHRETVLDSLSRDKVCRPLAYVVLASSTALGNRLTGLPHNKEGFLGGEFRLSFQKIRQLYQMFDASKYVLGPYF